MAFRGSSRYPHINKEDYATRAWLLVRKVRRARVTTDNDRRVAMLLLEREPNQWSALAVRGELEQIAYGTAKSEGSSDS